MVSSLQNIPQKGEDIKYAVANNRVSELHFRGFSDIPTLK
jgi:hypothetical protein